MRFKLRVPAKVILFGEHAVVYNQPAIVCAIDSYTSATVTIHASPFCMINLKYQNVFDDHFEVTYSESTSLSPNTQPISEHNHPEWLIALSTLAEHFLFPKSSILIDINSHVPLSAGLGSSASIFVLLAASLHLSSSSHDSDHLTLTQEDLLAVNAAAHAAERVIHGPAASGVDNTVITHGGCIRYQSGSSVPLPSLPLSMALGYCGRQKGSTREMVERAGLHFATADGTKDLEAFRSVTKSAILEFKKPDVSPSLYALITRAHGLLSRTGVSSPELEELVSWFRCTGWASKLTGAGGGGCVLAVGGSDLPSSAPPGMRVWRCNAVQSGLEVVLECADDQ